MGGDAEQLKTELSMIVEFEFTRKDYQAFNYYHFCLSPRKKESRRVWRALALLAFPLFIYLQKGLNFERYGTPEIVFLSFGIVLVATLPCTSKWVSNMQVNNLVNSGKNKSLLGGKKITIDEEKLIETTACSTSEIAWSGLECMEEGPNHFFLYTAVNQAIVVPKRAFPGQEDINRFRTFINSKLNRNAMAESPSRLQPQ